MQKRVESFSKKKMWFWLSVIAVIFAFSILQLAFTWVFPGWFSWFAIPSEINGIARKIISTIICLLALVFAVLSAVKIYQISKRKVYLNTPWIKVLFVVIVFAIYFLIPSAIPMNYIIPIIVLFWFVISVF